MRITKATTSSRRARGVVVAPQPIAVEVGADILREGGNAIDAAMATAFAQGVVDPFMGGIGGFGCMCVHASEAGRTETIGFHGKAGSLARPDIFTKDVLGQIHGHGERYEVKEGVNQIGHRSVAVPGVLAGFSEAHRKYGKLPWHVLFEHAIALAREGIALPGEVYDRWTEMPEEGHRSGWERITATPGCRALFAPEGEILRPGAPLRQTDYAATLERLAKAGAQDFYTGEIGSAIAADFKKHDGLFDANDLAGYRPTVAPPVCSTYRGMDVRSMPLPASGPQLAMMLNILEKFDLGRMYDEDPLDYVHIVARAILMGFVERAKHFGDPAFVNPPLEWLLSEDYAGKQALLIDSDAALEVAGMAYREAKTTTHVCVIDDSGNAVSLTHTLGSASGVVVPGLGFVFNNCMYQFNPNPGFPNSIAPGKSRLTGVTPTILMRDGVPWAAFGGLGGTRILTAILHTILNILDLRLSPVEAVSAPRFHVEGPWLELESRLSHAMGDRLEQRGWQLRPSPRGYDKAFALAFVALRNTDGTISGGSDPRGGGWDPLESTCRHASLSIL